MNKFEEWFLVSVTAFLVMALLGCAIALGILGYEMLTQ